VFFKDKNEKFITKWHIIIYQWFEKNTNTSLIQKLVKVW